MHMQAVYFLCSGLARLPSDYPKFLWKYPMFYVSFHTYFFQVNFTSAQLQVNP
jgi:hypothetical protein